MPESTLTDAESFAVERLTKLVGTPKVGDHDYLTEPDQLGYLTVKDQANLRTVLTLVSRLVAQAEADAPWLLLRDVVAGLEAQPEGWNVVIQHFRPSGYVNAEAGQKGPESRHLPWYSAQGDTPEAAIAALHRQLTESANG